MLKRMVILALAAAAILGFIFEAQAQEKIKIGIILSSDQSQYTQSLKGVLSQLKKEGFGEERVSFIIRDAENKKDKVEEIAREFIREKMNMVIPIGTQAAVGACNEIKNIPIIFCLVFSPVEAGIVQSLEGSGTNVTGTSNWVEMNSLVKLLREISPGKRIGVFYSQEERQTVIQLEAFKKIQNKIGFTVVPANLTRAEDALNIANKLVESGVDSIYLPGGTVVGQCLDIILGVTRKARIHTISHLVERVEKGALLAIAVDSFQLGELTGRKAVQVLKGVNPAYIPIETLEQYDVTVNLKTAKEMGLEIPDSILKSAKNIIQPAKISEKIKIGIVRFSDEGFFLEGLKGILSQLKKDGFNETKVDFDIRNAEGKKEKVIEIIKEFKDKKPNLLITLGTMPTISAANEIKDIPIVFSTVFDPIGSGIAQSWESSENNTTGSSTWVDLSSMVKAIRKIAPGKLIGVIYNEAEKNSVLQLAQFNKLQDKLGFKVVPVNLLKPEDAKLAVEAIVGKVDCIFLTGSTVVGKGIEVILEVVKKAKIPSIAHLQERANQGVMLVVAANSFSIGELAGKKAAQVLRGIKPSYIPIESLEEYDITINLKTAREMGLEIPASLLKTAKRVIQ